MLGEDQALFEKIDDISAHLSDSISSNHDKRISLCELLINLGNFVWFFEDGNPGKLTSHEKKKNNNMRIDIFKILLGFFTA